MVRPSVAGRAAGTDRAVINLKAAEGIQFKLKPRVSIIPASPLCADPLRAWHSLAVGSA
jgi:hypothetical protein